MGEKNEEHCVGGAAGYVAIEGRWGKRSLPEDHDFVQLLCWVLF